MAPKRMDSFPTDKSTTMARVTLTHRFRGLYFCHYKINSKISKFQNNPVIFLIGVESHRTTQNGVLLCVCGWGIYTLLLCTSVRKKTPAFSRVFSLAIVRQKELPVQALTQSYSTLKEKIKCKNEFEPPKSLTNYNLKKS